MGREIKFRAFHKEAKDMVYFGLGENGMTAYSLEDGQNYTLDVGDDHPVMQFTGLLDKNGVCVYEGDIIATPHFKDAAGISHKLLHFVEWSDKYHGWFLLNCSSMDEEDGSIQMFVTTRNTDDFEVIGNIYENSDLLNGEQ